VEIERQLRKVLIIGEESSARDTMRVLLGSMGCQCVVASTVQQAIAVLEQESPDAVIVDPLSTSTSASSIAAGFDKIYPSLRGRALVLSGKEGEPEVRDLLEQYSLPRVSRDRLLQELWGSLESFFRPKEVLRRIINATHLVFDSFLQPMPAGVRGNPEASRRISGSNRKPIPVISLWWAKLRIPTGSTVSLIPFPSYSMAARAPSRLQRPASSANFTLTSISSLA